MQTKTKNFVLKAFSKKHFFVPVFIVFSIVINSYALKPAGNNIALQGAGKALIQGPASLWNNPATLWLQTGAQVQSGSMYTNGTLLPWAIGGSSLSSISAVALGYNQDRINQTPVHLVALGVAIHPTPHLLLGFSSQFQNYGEGLALDLNAGVHYELSKQFQLGADIQNGAEALEKTELIPTNRRTLGTGFVWNLDHSGHFMFTGDANFSHKSIIPDQNIWGLGFTLGKHKNIQLISSTAFDKNQNWKKAIPGASLRLQEIFFSSLIRFQYSIVGQDGFHGSNISHSAEFGFVIDPFRDQNPPLLSVGVDQALLIPTDSLKERSSVHFILSAKDFENTIESWHLVIYKAGKLFTPTDPIRSWHGKGTPPHYIRWSGNNNLHELLPSGFYTFRLIAIDSAGNPEKTSWQLIEIRDSNL